jgi:mono/diheme cytochrome c family protein
MCGMDSGTLFSATSTCRNRARRFGLHSLAASLLAICFAGVCAADSSAAPPSAEVGRGAYLVLAANCISCHTTSDGKAYAGGKAFDTGFRFLGRIYSSNITPDRQTGIGAWSETDFVRAMREGIAPDGRHLFPAFPYTAFSKLAAGDIKAIFAYLRTVAPVRAETPGAGFWFRQRWAMSIWNTLFFTKGELAARTDQSAQWNRGAYLVESLGHCSACHTPRNLLLAERADLEFTGGITVGEVEPGKQRSWSAPNLTGAQSGLAKWPLEDLEKYLKGGFSRRAGVLGPMNEVIANSLRYLTSSDIAAIAVYLKSRPANGESAQQTLSAAARTSGQTIYEKYCDECHLSTGRGGFRKAPPVAGSPLVQAAGAASLLNVILFGAAPASGLPPSLDVWESMPGFKDKLSDTQAADLANFLRSSWDNRGALVRPSFVAEQR